MLISILIAARYYRPYMQSSCTPNIEVIQNVNFILSYACLASLGFHYSGTKRCEPLASSHLLPDDVAIVRILRVNTG